MINIEPDIALVTGGTGFIGSNLIKKLIFEGWKVHVIIRSSSAFAQLEEVKEKVFFHIYDGSIESLLKTIESSKPTVVFHLASLFLAQHKPEDIAAMIQSNLTFSTQLVEAMIANKVYQLINTGTSWQHFENKDYSPVCLYAATKQAFEVLLQFYIETTSLQVITLKLFDSYGINDSRGKLFSLLQKLSSDLQPLSMSPGEQKINLVYIEDIVEAYLISAKRLQSGLNCSHESYAVRSDSSLSLREIVSIYERETGISLPIVWGGRPYRDREVMEPCNIGNQLKNWQPKTSIEIGIRKIIKTEKTQ